MHLTHPKYRCDIDGLRAIAILSVVSFHAFPNWLQGGFIGVDIFFVISGYLISSIIIGNLENNSFSFIEFYIRRINRIFPALLLVLIGCLAFGWLVLLADEYKQLGKHIAGGAGFISNYLYWQEVGYFNNAADTKPLLHLWSLGIEEQFYIAWPLLLWFAYRQRLNLLTISIVVVLISFGLNINMVSSDTVAAFYSPQTRFWELLVGSILAYFTLHRQIIPKFKSWLMALFDRRISHSVHAHEHEVNNTRTLRSMQSLFGATLIIVGFIVISKGDMFPGWWAVLPVAGAFLIISAGEFAWLNRIVLSSRILVWFGLISYPLYLWHWPLLSFIRIMEGETASHEIRIAAILLAILLAWITYLFIEKPIRNRDNSKFKTVTLIAIMIIVGSFGFAVYKFDRLISRLPIAEKQRIQFIWDKSYNSSAECKKKYHGDTYCNISDINSPPNAAIIGDSFANHFFWGLSEYYKKKGGNLLNVGGSGCPPFFEINMEGENTSANCYGRTKSAYDFVLNSEDITTVYISFRHDAYFASWVKFTDSLNQIKHEDNDKDHYRYVLNALLRTIKMLDDKGKTVVLIYDMPELNKDIKGCFKLRTINFKKTCKFDKSIFVSDFKRYDKMISEISRRVPLLIFDTHKYIEGNFPVDKNGIPMYRDKSHLSINGSLFFSDKYIY